MHRLAGPLVRARSGTPFKVRLKGQDRRSTASLALPYLLLKSEPHSTTRQEVSRTTEPKSYRHDLSPTYFDSMQKPLIRSGVGDSKSVVHRFRQALEQRNVAALHLTYAELRKEAIQLKDPSHASSHTQAQSLSELNVQDIRSAMELALGTVNTYLFHSRKSEKLREEDQPRRSATEREQDGSLVQQMFQDMHSVFDFAVDRRDCKRSVLSCALQTSSSQEVFNHLQQLRSTFEVYSSSNYVHEGAVIMRQCNKEADGIHVAQQFWSLLESIKVKIHKGTRDSFLRLLFKAGRVDQAKDIAQYGYPSLRMLPVSLQETPSLSRFLEGFGRAGQGHWKPAVQMADELMKRARRDRTLVLLSDWQNLLIYTATVKGPAAAIKMARSAQEEELFEADEETFTVLLMAHEVQMRNIAQGGTEEDVMRLFAKIEGSCRVAPSSSSFAIAVQALLGMEVPSLLYKSDNRKRAKIVATIEDKQEENLEDIDFVNRRSVPRHTPGQIHEAGLLYRRLRSRSLQPTSTLFVPLIVAYTSAYIPQLGKALELYRDWRSFGGEIQIGIYNILLLTCAKVKNMTAAQQIIRGMMESGISLNQRALSDLVVLLMEASYSFQSAHDIYVRVRDAAAKLSGSDLLKKKQKVAVFDELGWLKIIDRYSKLEFERGSSPPIGNLLGMLVDMRASGFAPEPKQYTTLLKSYGKSASSALRSIHDLAPDDTARRKGIFLKIEEMKEAIFAIHEFLRIEESIEPDLVLITALMDAYNRVNRSQHALEIWHRLELNKTLVDSACIAVILDTCGHAGLLRDARRAWRWVRRNEQQAQHCSKGVWDAWVECLARCGNLSEAIDTVFSEMQTELKERGQGEAVDAMTIEMLLRFASTEKHRWNRDSIEEYPLLTSLKDRIQVEMPGIWNQVKSIHIPL